MMIAPPEGISEDDYEAIEAAVMETVRGRWFLAEFARRSRVDEMRQVLDAIGRLENVVADQRALPADPSIRLFVQRLKDVGQQLDGLAAELRLQGQDEALCARVEAQARAVGGLLRLNGGSATLAGPSPEAERFAAVPPLAAPTEVEAPWQPAPSLPPLPAPNDLPSADQKDARLAALARLDGLPFAEKLALFG